MRRAVPIALISAALCAPAAEAGTVGGADDLTFRAGPHEENRLRVFDERASGTVRFRDGGAAVTAMGPLCRLDGADAVCGPALGLVQVVTGDRDDRYHGPAPAHLGAGDDIGRGQSLRGGRGADILTGTRRDDLLLGGDGRDVIRGGPGPDFITAGRGRDVVWSGSGRDQIGSYDGAPDVVICGGGVDVVNADRFDTLVSCEDR